MSPEELREREHQAEIVAAKIRLILTEHQADLRHQGWGPIWVTVDGVEVEL